MFNEFEKFLTRLDEEFIETIIGKDAIAILNTIDPELGRLERIQKTMLNVYSPVELLQNKTIRNLFIDVLKFEEIVVLAERLGIRDRSDIYENIKKINFSRENEKIILLNFYGIDLPLEEEESVFLYSQALESIYSLFQHQRKAVSEVKVKLYSAQKKVMLHMPTGSGKTRTAINVICEHIRSHEPTVVIWFANTEELCEQAFEEFSKAWKVLGNRKIETIKFWGSSNVLIGDSNDTFIVAGLTKIYNLLKTDLGQISKLAAKVTLVIMDEAHMAIAPTYKTILNILSSYDASLLGLSATPGRTWNDPIADMELANFFNRNKVTLKVEGFNNPVEFLINKGYLAKIKNSSLLYESGLKITSKDLDYLKDYLQLPEKLLKTISEDRKRNIRIIQEVEKLVLNHSRIILFSINVQHANLLATVLQARGIDAFSITSNTEMSQRRKLIERYKSNSENSIVLCNYGILTTGFDAPRTSCAVIARPTDSLVLYSQMVGRAIRGVNAGGNLEAEIITVVDTALPGFDEIANAFFNWEDVWN
jgi:superfamily II DNA or RNA helicase